MSIRQAGPAIALASLVVLFTSSCGSSPLIHRDSSSLSSTSEPKVQTIPTNTLLSTPSQTVSMIPMVASDWEEEIIKNYEGLPEASWADGVLTISAPAPTFNQYPAKAWWSKSATKIMAGHAYTMEVDLRVSGGLQGNVLVGLNARHNEGHPNWFQHWHANANSGYDDNHYGDWTEQACVSDVPVDGAWHSVRLVWDGVDMLDYWIDGVLVCTQARTYQDVLLVTEKQTFRVYVERYPDPEGPIYTIQIRNFQVR